MIKDIIKIFTNPITKTLEYANRENIKFSFILSAIIIGILTVLNSISFTINSVMVKSYSYAKGKYTTKVDFKNFEFEEFIKNFFTTAIVIFVAMLLIATIMYIISRILKNDNSFGKLLTISAISTIPIIFSTVFSLLISWLYAPVTYFVSIAAVLYMLFINIYAFRRCLEIEDEDKLTMYNVIAITATFIILFYIALGVFSDSISLLSNFM